MIVSANFIPNEQDSRALVECSQRLFEAQPGLIQLGPGCLPHITIAQFVVTGEAEAKVLQEQTKQLAPESWSLKSAGLSFIPDWHDGKTWIELQFLKSQAITELQTIVLQTDFATTHELHSSASDLYRPHCTLGLLKTQTLPLLNLATFTIFNRMFEQLQFAIGINGDNFTLTKQLPAT